MCFSFVRHLFFFAACVSIFIYAGSMQFAQAASSAQVQISALPGFVLQGQSTIVSWSSQNAVSCSGERDWSGEKPTQGTFLVIPQKTFTTFILNCFGSDQKKISASVTIEIVQPLSSTALPILDFKAENNLIANGGTTRLIWSARNATTCSVSTQFLKADGTPDQDIVTYPENPNWWTFASIEMNGTKQVSPPQNVEYKIKCKNGSTSTTKMVRLTVGQVATMAMSETRQVEVTLAASQALIARGQQAQIVWKADGATACQATSELSSTEDGSPARGVSDWSGAVDVSGSTHVTVNETTRYRLRCAKGSESWTENAITVIAQNVSASQQALAGVYFTPGNATIFEGQSISVYWNSEGVTGCTQTTPDSKWFGFQPTTGTVSVSPQSSTVYVMQCWNAQGASVSSTLRVTVQKEADVDLTFTSSAEYALPNEAVTLTWSSVGARSCAASGAWIGDKRTDGSEIVRPPVLPVTYSITCRAWHKTVTKDVTVRAITPFSGTMPTVEFSSDKRSVVKGESATLVWKTTGVTNCESSSIFLDDQGKQSTLKYTDDWLSVRRQFNGQETIKPFSNTVYRLTCTAPGVRVTKKIRVALADKSVLSTEKDQVGLTFIATPTVAQIYSRVTLRWDSKNATRCTASGSWKGAKELQSIDGAGFSLGQHGVYSLECAQDGGAAAETTLEVIMKENSQSFYARPTVSLEASSPRVEKGSDVLVKWSSQNAVACAGSGPDGWLGIKPVQGTSRIQPALEATYRIDCWNDAGFLAPTATTTIAVISSLSVASSSTPVQIPQTPTPKNDPVVAKNTPPMPVIAQKTSPVQIEKLSFFKPTKRQQGSLVSLKGTGKIWHVRQDLSLAVLNEKNFMNSIFALANDATREELAQIQVADFRLPLGYDSDSDGLSDPFEAALGTDPNNPDTDSDGYSDGTEVKNKYNPLWAGKQPVNRQYQSKMKGLFLRQSDSAGELWYIDPQNLTRYFIQSDDDVPKLTRERGFMVSPLQKRLPVKKKK